MTGSDAHGRTVNVDEIRKHVDIVLAAAGPEATWRVSPTALADGWTYEVTVRGFVSRRDVEQTFAPRYVLGMPVTVSADVPRDPGFTFIDDDTFVRSVN